MLFLCLHVKTATVFFFFCLFTLHTRGATKRPLVPLCWCTVCRVTVSVLEVVLSGSLQLTLFSCPLLPLMGHGEGAGTHPRFIWVKPGISIDKSPFCCRTLWEWGGVEGVVQYFPCTCVLTPLLLQHILHLFSHNCCSDVIFKVVKQHNIVPQVWTLKLFCY